MREFDHLAPLAGRGRSRSDRVRGTLREFESVERAPHPDPPRVSFARLDPASGGRGRISPPAPFVTPRAEPIPCFACKRVRTERTRGGRRPIQRLLPWV